MTTRRLGIACTLSAVTACVWSALALFASEWGAGLMGMPHSDEAEDPCVYLASISTLADDAVMNALGAFAAAMIAGALALMLRKRRAHHRVRLIASAVAIALCAVLLLRSRTYRSDVHAQFPGLVCEIAPLSQPAAILSRWRTPRQIGISRSTAHRAPASRR